MNDQRKPIRFDTKTGQPIYEEPQAQRRPVRYDTTTGQPIYDDAPSYGGQNAYGQGPQNYGGQNTYGQGPQNYGGFDAYGQGAGTRSAKPKKKSPLKPIIIIVAILAVLAGAFFGVRAVLGSAGGPLAKIAKATYNTFKDDEAFMQLQNMNGLISDNTFKMNVKADAGDEKFDFVYDQKGTGNSFEQSLTGEIEMYGEKIEFAEYLEKYQITVDVPEYLTQPVTYDFSEKAADPGYIAEQIDEDTLDALDTLLRVALDKLSDPEAAQKEATKIVMDHVKDLEFEKIDKEKIDLGSRKAECGGYEVEIDGDFMQDLWDELMENAMGEDMEEALDAIYEATGEDLSYYMDEDMFSDMPDITLRFYIEKKNLVCIEAEVEDDTAKVTFADEDVPCHEIHVFNGDDEMGSLEVKVKNNKETFTLTSYDSEVGSLEYDLKSGDFEVESSYYDEAILKGQFYIDKKEAYLAIDMEDDDVFAEFSITKDAKVQKIDGKAFDIRTADEEEFMDLLDY